VVTVLSRVSGVGSSLPTIISASSRAVTELGSGTSPTVLPARITVIASACFSTSSSLCEMKITVEPEVSSAQRGEQLVDLLGDQHGGGLVEDQDVGAPVEHLEDLAALLLADAEVGDERVGVDLEPVRCRARADVGARPLDVERKRLPGS
jgi:hypothetical protein